MSSKGGMGKMKFTRRAQLGVVNNPNRVLIRAPQHVKNPALQFFVKRTRAGGR